MESKNFKTEQINNFCEAEFLDEDLSLHLHEILTGCEGSVEVEPGIEGIGELVIRIKLSEV